MKLPLPWVILVKEFQFQVEEGYRSEYLVSYKNKRQRYIAKFNKAINTVTKVIIQNADIDEINKSNDLLEVIMNKISTVFCSLNITTIILTK